MVQKKKKKLKNTFFRSINFQDLFFLGGSIEKAFGSFSSRSFHSYWCIQHFNTIGLYAVCSYSSVGRAYISSDSRSKWRSHCMIHSFSVVQSSVSFKFEMKTASEREKNKCQIPPNSYYRFQSMQKKTDALLKNKSTLFSFFFFFNLFIKIDHLYFVCFIRHFSTFACCHLFSTSRFYWCGYNRYFAGLLFFFSFFFF